MLGDVDYELTSGEINRRLRWERHFEESIEMMTKKCEAYNRKKLLEHIKKTRKYKTFIIHTKEVLINGRKYCNI